MRHTIVAVTLLVAIALCSAQPQTLTDVISTNPSFSILYKLLQSTGLTYTLSQPTMYTVFAPNNTAFNALPPAALKFLLDPNNSNLLKDVLLYHVLPGNLASYDLIAIGNGSTIATAQGSTISVNARNPFYLLYTSVLNINDARVIKADIPASNGVIHSVDRVLLTDTWNFGVDFGNVFGIISRNPDLSTLKYALEATGLTQFTGTIFAPTNEAFADPLLAPLFESANIKLLTNVLLYHVIGGQQVFSTQLYDGLQVATLNSASPLITVTRTVFPGASSTMINDALVLTTDANAFDGVVHTINRVLLPKIPFN